MDNITHGGFRKAAAFMLTAAMITAGIFAYPPAYAAGTADTGTAEPTVYYHLDMGIQMAYAGSEWTKNGYDWGGIKSNMTATIAFPQDVDVIAAYPLNSQKGSRFDFDGPTSSTNIPVNLISECKKLSSEHPVQAAYNKYYNDYVSVSMGGSIESPKVDGNKVSFAYTATFKTLEPLGVVQRALTDKDKNSGIRSKGTTPKEDTVWQLFGGKDKVSNADVKAAIEDAVNQAYAGTAGNNELYLVFCPTVIAYTKTAEVPVETTPGAIDPGTTGGGIDKTTPDLIDPGDITTPDAPETSSKVHKLALNARGLTGSCKDSASRVNHVGETDSAFQYWKITVKLSEYDKSGHPIVTVLQNNNIQKNGDSSKFTVTFPRVGTYKVYGSRWWYCEEQGTHTHYKKTADGHKTKHCTFLQYSGGAVIEQHGGVGPYKVVITPKDVNRPIDFDENWEQVPHGTDTVMIE